MSERRGRGRTLRAGLFIGLATALMVGTTAAASNPAPRVSGTVHHTATAPSSTLEATGPHFEGLLRSGQVLSLKVGGRPEVYIDGEAATLNITVAEPQAPGFLTVYPCGTPLPTASTVNYVAGQIVANAVVAKMGEGADQGKVCIFAYATTHVVVDLSGFFLNGANYTPLAPERLVDTRPGYPTFDGQFSGGGMRPAGSVLELPVVNRGGVPANAKSVALNVTVAEAQAPGFITVFPCGQPVPTASNVNYVEGSVVPNQVMAKVGDGGKVCFFSYAPTQLIVDINGWFPDVAAYTPVNPARLMDTRPGYPTADGVSAGAGMRTAGSVTELQVGGRGGIPLNDAKAVVLNVTVAEPQGPGFVTVYPCGTPVPTASNVNYVEGDVVPNSVFSKLSADGKVCLFTYNATQIVVDVNGYFPQDAAYQPRDPVRIADTRTS